MTKDHLDLLSTVIWFVFECFFSLYFRTVHRESALKDNGWRGKKTSSSPGSLSFGFSTIFNNILNFLIIFTCFILVLVIHKMEHILKIVCKLSLLINYYFHYLWNVKFTIYHHCFLPCVYVCLCVLCVGVHVYTVYDLIWEYTRCIW